MAFDPSTAKPLPGGFDPSTASPVAEPEGGAAFGVYPKQRAVPSKPETGQRLQAGLRAAGLLPAEQEREEFDPSAVGTSAGLGAGLGAVAPQALRAGGRMVGMIPSVPTRAAGALMTGLGTAMQATPASVRAARGASMLGGAEAGKQVAETVGAPSLLGEALGGGAGALSGRAAAGAARGMLGAPSATSETYARAAEGLGFRLSPAQVKQTSPVSSRGSTFNAEHNQRLANQLASSATGQEGVGRNFEISPDYIRGRLRDLGNQFNELYQGRVFNIDSAAVDAIRGIANIEAQLPASASVSAVRGTANTIINNFDRLASRAGAQANTFGIEGDALQRLRTDLLQAARSTSSRQDAHQIYELVDVIDQSVARNHPDIARRLDVLRPQYRNTIILEDLTRKGGIQQGNISLEKLGDMLGGRKEGVRTGNRADVDRLGELGRTLKLRALWEPVGGGETATQDILKRALGTTLGGAAELTGMRSRPARAVQRYFAEPLPEQTPFYSAPRGPQAPALPSPTTNLPAVR